MQTKRIPPRAAVQLRNLIAREVATAVRENPAIQQLQKQPVRTDWGDLLRGVAPAMHTRSYTEQPGHGFAAMVRCAALGGGNPHSAMQFAKDLYGEQSKVYSGFRKAMAAGDMTAGGFFVPQGFSDEVIELLRPLSVVRALQPRMVRIPRGQLSFPKLTGSASANYVAENTDIPLSEPTVGEVDLVARKLTCLCVLSNDLIRFSNELAEDEIRTVMLEEMAKTEDLNLLRGPGTQNKPLGILGRVASSNVLSSNGTSATDIEDDFKDLINALDTADVRFVRPAWIMNPAQKNHLRNLRDANGNLMLPEIRNTQPKIYGYPVLTSTQVPTNEVYLVEGSQVVMGEVEGVQVVTSGDAAYVQDNTLASAFSRDQTAIRVVTLHDIMLRHDVAAAVINDVAWG